jgi:hypothetical protein
LIIAYQDFGSHKLDEGLVFNTQKRMAALTLAHPGSFEPLPTIDPEFASYLSDTSYSPHS